MSYTRLFKLLLIAIGALASLFTVFDWMGFSPFKKNETTALKEATTQVMTSSPGGVQVVGSNNTIQQNKFAEFVLDTDNVDSPVLSGDFYKVVLTFRATNTLLPSRLCVIAQADKQIQEIHVAGMTTRTNSATSTTEKVAGQAAFCFSDLTMEEIVVLKFKEIPSKINAFATTTDLLPF